MAHFSEGGVQHTAWPTPGPSGRSLPRPAFPDPVPGLPGPPFPLRAWRLTSILGSLQMAGAQNCLSLRGDSAVPGQGPERSRPGQGAAFPSLEPSISLALGWEKHPSELGGGRWPRHPQE